MKHHNVARWLKAGCIGAAALGAVVFGMQAPRFAASAALAFPRFAGLRIPGLAWVWGIGVLCYFSLWRFWGVCRRIGEDQSFSPQNAAAMGGIARYLWAAAGMAVALTALLYSLKIRAGGGWSPDNLWLLILLTCFFMGVALLSQALSLLLAKAVALQEEHDLTV